MRSWWIGLASVLAVFAAHSAVAAPDGWCGDCQLQLGAGATYHYWGPTGGIVIPVTAVVDHGQYEIGAFRFASSQRFYNHRFNEELRTANPYWGFSVSRRWNLIKRPYWRLLLGFGGSYKTEENDLSSSHWNFAEQLGLRITPNRRFAIELTARHWSNAGLKLPNRGQDFATLNFVVFTGPVGR